ncbi:YciI family protein [Actinophytocola sp.]|uniref:YciI family protein n=1 Tax=Actinophytocola sp. TaxID=1872138 RepID=UPI002ED9C389
MKYLLMICTDGAFDPAAHKPDELDAQPWVDEMTRRGIRSAGNRLQDPADATTVRVRDGLLMVTDGPFAETKEQIGGFDIVDCADLDEAIEVASKHPMAKLGMVEVRPFWTA